MKTLIFFLMILCSTAAEKLKICTTLPDLANLSMAVGGREVVVSTLILAAQNPHTLNNNPRSLTLLKEAQLFIKSGFDLEASWLPKLLKNSGNSAIQPGKQSHLDPSSIIKPIVTGKATFTRLSGRGQVKVNPHYLLDPINAILTTQLICSRMKVLMPKKAAYFNKRRSTFQMSLWTKLIGSKMAKKYDSAILTKLIKRGKLEETIVALSKKQDIGGWLGKVKVLQNKKYILDHDSYAYFFRRFGLVKFATLQSYSGTLPNKSHLEKLKNKLQGEKISGLITTPWFPKNIITKFLADSQFKEIKLAHQSLELKGGESYIEMIEMNIEELSNKPLLK